MTAAGIIVGGVALVYLVMLDVHLTRRCDGLADDLDLLRAELDRTVIRISYLEDAARIPRAASVRPVEPSTRPIRLPVPERTDTEPVAAVIDAGLRKLSGATASGRHRA